MSAPLVLIPGLMCDARLFAPQTAHFCDKPGTMVADISGADRIEALARQVLQDAPERFALCGLSMGGIVAMAIMKAAPERVTRLALLDTNPLAERPEIARTRDRQIDEAQAGGLSRVMRDEMKPNYLAPGPRRADVLETVMTMALDLGVEVFERQSRALQNRSDYRAALPEISCPTLVLCGEMDALCPPQRHKMMADLIPGATLCVISGAGHLPVLEQPGTVNTHLDQWLAS